MARASRSTISLRIGALQSSIDPVASRLLRYFPLADVHRISGASRITGQLSRSPGGGHDVKRVGNRADACTQGPNSGRSISSSVYYTETFTPTLLLSVPHGFAGSKALTNAVAQDFLNFNPVTALCLPNDILTAGYLATPDVTLGSSYGR